MARVGGAWPGHVPAPQSLSTEKARLHAHHALADISDGKLRPRKARAPTYGHTACKGGAGLTCTPWQLTRGTWQCVCSQAPHMAGCALARPPGGGDSRRLAFSSAWEEAGTTTY